MQQFKITVSIIIFNVEMTSTRKDGGWWVQVPSGTQIFFRAEVISTFNISYKTHFGEYYYNIFFCETGVSFFEGGVATFGGC